jgi:threonine aldolase
MGNSQVSVKLLAGDRGRVSVDEIAANINNDDQHYPRTAVVALENTVVREAGSFYSLKDIEKISAFARSKNLHMHLDGARLFNALVATGEDAGDYGRYFDTISICLSKGLGAPVGSVLVCKKEFAKKARRMRKVFGGAWRQAGFLAAAGIYALDNHIGRLKEDHARAKVIGECLQQLSFVKSVMPVDTNIVIFELESSVSPALFLEKIGEHQIKALAFSANEVRMVTHLDFDDAMLQSTITILNQLHFS